MANESDQRTDNRGEANSSGRSGNSRSGRRRYFRRRKSNSNDGAEASNQTVESKKQTGGDSDKPAEKKGESGGSSGRSSNRRSSAGRSSNRRSSSRRRSSSSDKQPDAPKERSASSNERTGSKRHSSRRSSPSGAAKAENPERGSRRTRRSRRRSGNGERGERARPVQESIIDTIAHEYTPPKSVFVYTHVTRPAYQGMGDFRTEHFPRVGRTLDDFSVDISLLFDEEGNMLAPGTLRRPGEETGPDTYVDGDWEEAEENEA